MKMARHLRPPARLCLLAGLSVLTIACDRDPFALTEVPAVDEYCLAAQRVVSRTTLAMDLVVHESFESFVKSKAIIDESGDKPRPVLQQFNWADDAGHLLGISCKLKSADHLNLIFGDGSAGPDGLCQEMNQAVFKLIAKRSGSPAFSRVTFDPAETVSNAAQPGMTGPDPELLPPSPFPARNAMTSDSRLTSRSIKYSVLVSYETGAAWYAPT